TWLLVDDDVWNALTPEQQALAKVVARENILSSYGENMAKQGPAVKYILDANRGDADTSNDIMLVEWPKKDQERMRAAAVQFLNARPTDSSLPEQDRADYVTILEALRKYVASGDLYWDHKSVKPASRFDGWTNDLGQPWAPKYRYEK
ncbi:MAG TPA: hypothetical protein VD838_12755, partial [Anaeromyxobacteraceae bacterium]|nr:hypothetical protein [Anaeromyxobacteraceae bacterium]